MSQGFVLLGFLVCKRFANPNIAVAVFYLDVLTRKEIYPDDFSTEQKYRIFYEEESDIIVKVEEIQ